MQMSNLNTICLQVRRMILLNFHKPGLQHHLLRITTPSLETLSPECQPKQSQLQDLLSIAANIEKCKLVGMLAFQSFSTCSCFGMG